MNNFKLNKNEELLKIFEDIYVEANENKLTTTLFVTNERIVLLKDINKDYLYNEFLKARGTSISADLEIIFETSIKKISNIGYKNNINYISFTDNENKLLLYCDDLNNVLNKRK